MFKRKNKLQALLQALQSLNFASAPATLLLDCSVMIADMYGKCYSRKLRQSLQDYNDKIHLALNRRDDLFNLLMTAVDKNPKLSAEAIMMMPLKEQMDMYDILVKNAETNPKYIPLRDMVGTIISDSFGNGIRS